VTAFVLLAMWGVFAMNHNASSNSRVPLGPVGGTDCREAVANAQDAVPGAVSDAQDAVDDMVAENPDLAPYADDAKQQLADSADAARADLAAAGDDLGC